MKAEEEKQEVVEEEVPIADITTRHSPVALHKRSRFTGASAESCFTACQTVQANFFFSALHIQEGGGSFLFTLIQLFYVYVLSHVLWKLTLVQQPAIGGSHNRAESPVKCRPRPLAAWTQLPLWPPPLLCLASGTCWQKPKKNCFPCCQATSGKGRPGRRCGGRWKGLKKEKNKEENGWFAELN